MIFRNLNLYGPYPIGRDAKLLGEALTKLLLATYRDQQAGLFADVETRIGPPINNTSGILIADIKLRMRGEINLAPVGELRISPAGFSVITEFAICNFIWSNK